jgi:bacterioferritin
METQVEHLLYLDGVPNMQRLEKKSVGETVPEQLKVDVKLEMEAVELLRKPIPIPITHYPLCDCQ